MGGSQKDALRVDFDRHIKLEFHGSTVTSDAGLLAYRQLDRDYDRLCQGDLSTLEACWRERLGLLGKHVVAECHDAAHHGRLTELSFRAVELAQPGEPSLVLAPERIQHLWEAAEPIRI